MVFLSLKLICEHYFFVFDHQSWASYRYHSANGQNQQLYVSSFVAFTFGNGLHKSVRKAPTLLTFFKLCKTEFIKKDFFTRAIKTTDLQGYLGAI